jgi:branched-chain amino acid transport system ATP-binding protein
VRDEVAIREQAMHILADVGLDSNAHDIASQLARGDKRRLELAVCLVQEPKLPLLDKPTAGIARADTNAIIDLWQKIASRGITMVVTEYDMHVVFSLEALISVLAQGPVIAQGLLDEIKGNPRVQEAYLGGAQL